MKVMIIDDEHYAIKGLEYEISKIPTLEIVGTYQNYTEALNEISQLEPDIVFLDIEMHEVSGIDGFRKIKAFNQDINIIFVTAFDDYAIKAFELNAVDYLLKPVSLERLQNAIARIKEPVVYGEANREITIKCFKHFEVLIDGQLVSMNWRTKKAEELLTYLIIEKGHFVAKEKIAEELWPERNREKALSNLYLALHHLKKQEEYYKINFHIVSERGKIRVIYEELNCDLKIFDKGVVALETGNVKAIRQALEVYRGDLLHDQYYSWCREMEEKYCMDYERLLKVIKSE